MWSGKNDFQWKTAGHTHALNLFVHTPKGIQHHLFTCSDIAANNNYNKRVTKLAALMKEMETALGITTAVVGIMKHVRGGNNPSPNSFRSGSFGGDITINGIIRD